MDKKAKKRLLLSSSHQIILDTLIIRQRCVVEILSPNLLESLEIIEAHGKHLMQHLISEGTLTYCMALK